MKKCNHYLKSGLKCTNRGAVTKQGITMCEFHLVFLGGLNASI